MHGYGIKAQGIGGLGIALPQDGLAAATNPAGTVLVGDCVDVGVRWFSPKCHAELAGTGAVCARKWRFEQRGQANPM
jgi:long-chain fatty acid transport protein